MPEQTRAARNLAEDITHANQQLKRAREDGGCTAICHGGPSFEELVAAFSPEEPQPNSPKDQPTHDAKHHR